MALYKPGDRVLVRADLERHQRYPMEEGGGGNTVNEIMLELAGFVCTIRRVDTGGQYRLEEDSGEWRWTDGMFVGLAEECEDFDIPDGCGCLV